MNWRIERKRLYGGAAARGVGVTCEYGSLGHDARRRRHLFVSVTLWIVIGISLHVTWYS